MQRFIDEKTVYCPYLVWCELVIMLQHSKQLLFTQQEMAT